MTSPQRWTWNEIPPRRENNFERDPQEGIFKGAPQGRNSQEENIQKSSSGGPFRRIYAHEISLRKNTSGRDPQMVILQKGYFEDKSNSEQISTIKLLEGG